MCGIAGCLGSKGPGDHWDGLLDRLGSALRHRGPDDSGRWWDGAAGVGLAHRRLSVVDLSREGRQPMLSPGGRFVLSYNGEIYNFRQLRDDLSIPFRGHSDTEVLLAAIETWGLDAALKKCVGMFAFALWDRETATLSLVRDRAGVKPLYVGRIPGGLVFGSELGALKAHPAYNPPVDRDALTLLFRYGYIPAPWSIYRSTWKVEPGTIMEIGPGSAGDPERWSKRAYWSAREVFETGVADPLPADDAEAVSALEALLTDAVGLRMVADVPLGAFLSGGIDSSVVVALMQAQSERPVRTFSIGFEEAGYDEAPAAKAVARTLGTEHTELYLTPRQAMETIPRLPQIYDEPFADSSQLPTFLVSRMAREHVTVSLSGDGGDEAFGGYDHYRLGRLRQRLGRIPAFARNGLVRMLDARSEAQWTDALALARAVSPRPLARRLRGENVHFVADYLRQNALGQVYRRIHSLWTDPASLVKGGNEPALNFSAAAPSRGETDPALAMMYLDSQFYLPNDILVKVDRASMAVGLEARNPFLDHRVQAFAARTPLGMKIRDGQGKWILRRLLQRHMPRELFERPKKGFSIPVGEWLRGPLREWGEELLEPRRLREQGYLNVPEIRTLWQQHVNGTFNREGVLWTALMFQAWLDEQHGNRAGIPATEAACPPAHATP